MSVDADNQLFDIHNGYLINVLNSRAFLCLSAANDLILDAVVPNAFRYLGESCFSLLKTLNFTFQWQSQLRRIERNSFQCCSLKSILIPQSVEVLGKSCFLRSRIDDVSFELESRLKRVEAKCFAQCAIRVLGIPDSVEFIGHSRFANSDIGLLLFRPVSQLKHIRKISPFMMSLTTQSVIPPVLALDDPPAIPIQGHFHPSVSNLSLNKSKPRSVQLIRGSGFSQWWTPRPAKTKTADSKLTGHCC
jgi:hypothetical protein